MVIEARLLALFKLLLFILNRLTVLVVLDHFLEEGILGSLVSPWEAVKDVATITAVILAELELENFPEELVGDTDLLIGDLDLGPAILWLLQIGSLLRDFLLHCRLDFLKLRTAVVDQLILACGLLIDCSHAEYFIDELADMDSRDVIVLGELFRVECLTAGWRASDENLDWVESSVRIEFTFQRANVLSDAELGMPWELLFLNQFVLLILILQFLLLCSQWHCSEGIRGLHTQINCKSLLPALHVGDLVSCDTLDLSSAHALGHFSDDALLGRLSCLVNREDVRVHLRILDHNTSYKARQINDMDGGN